MATGLRLCYHKREKRKPCDRETCSWPARGEKRKKERRMSDESMSLQPLPQEATGIQVDLLAASLRADTGDLKAFLEVLAVKMEGALPNQTVGTRQSKLFSREHPVKEISITFGGYHYCILREAHGSLSTLRAQIVPGDVV